MTMFLNHYKCYRCSHEWQDEYDAQPDDDCPECGARHCSPYLSEDLEDDDSFSLANDTPKHVRKPVCDDQERSRQTMLLDGLDCLPGQMDLFDTPSPEVAPWQR